MEEISIGLHIRLHSILREKYMANDTKHAWCHIKFSLIFHFKIRFELYNFDDIHA